MTLRKIAVMPVTVHEEVAIVKTPTTLKGLIILILNAPLLTTLVGGSYPMANNPENRKQGGRQK